VNVDCVRLLLLRQVLGILGNYAKVNCRLDMLRTFVRFGSILDMFGKDSFGLLRVGRREMLQLVDLMLTQLI